MQTQVIENFKKGGIKITPDTTSLDLAEKLGTADVSKLKRIITLFCEGGAPDVEGDDFVQSLTYSNALISAFEFEDSSITEDDIQTAHQKALDALEGMVSYKAVSAEEDEALEEALQGEEAEEAEAGGERTAKQIVEELIHANPDATAPEIVQMVRDDHNWVSRHTARMYFYNIRRKLGWGTNGKRGRPSNDTTKRVAVIVANNMDRPKAEVTKLISDELGLAQSTADQYYSNAKSAIKKGEV